MSQAAIHVENEGQSDGCVVLEKTWLDGLSIWKRITGNNEYDRVSLQTYYLAIRDGLPDKLFEAPLVRLRQWLAERLHDMSPIYDNPAKAISAGARVRTTGVKLSVRTWLSFCLWQLVRSGHTTGPRTSAGAALFTSDPPPPLTPSMSVCVQ